MARIFKDCLEMVQEMDRELKVSGITVPVKHYQNKELVGENQNTKELIGVNFIISKPSLKKKEMLEFLFKDEADNIEKYCEQELLDRVNREGLNPGNSYKIRLDLWQSLMSKKDGEKFDYTYSERINYCNQLDNVIAALKDDIHSRRAMIMIFKPEDTQESSGFATRIPCSIDYQFIIRNNKLMVLYHIRSNDYFKHFAIDIWLANAIQEYIVEQLKDTYPNLKVGSLNYYCGSFHAYNEDLSNWVIY
jgi:thymidylate synthase